MDHELDRDRADAMLGDPVVRAGERSRLGALLSAAADVAPAEAPPALMQAMAVEVRSTSQPITQPRSRPVLAKVITAKVAALTAVVALTATGAAAATGSLPDAAQDRLSKAAEHVGINLPDAADDDAVDATTDVGPGNEGDLETEKTTAGEQRDERSEHGGMVSTIAQADHASGGDRGAVVSDVAKGEHGPDEQPTPDDAAEHTPTPGTASDSAPEPAPNKGDAATSEGNPAADAAPVETPADGPTPQGDTPPGDTPEQSQPTGEEASTTAPEGSAANARSDRP